MRRQLSLITLFLLFDFCGYAQEDTPTSANVNPCADYWEISYQHPYLEEADLLWENEEIAQAVDLYEIAAAKFNKEQNWEGLVKALNRISDNLIREYSDSAITVLQQSLIIARKQLEASPVDLAEIYLLTGKYYDIVASDLEKSIDFHQQSLTIKTNLFGQNHIDVARSYHAIGELYRWSGRYMDALEYLNKSIDIMVGLGCDTLLEVGFAYFTLSTSYRMLDDLDKAIIYALKALSVYDIYKDRTLNSRANCYQTLANIYLGRNDLERSKEYSTRAIGLLDQQPYLTTTQERLFANFLNTKASIHTQQNSYDSALFYNRESLAHYRNVPGSDASIALVMQNLGVNYTKLDQYDSAYQYLMDAIEMRRSIEGDKGFKLSSTLRFTGDLFLQTGELDSALFYYQQAIVSGAGKDFNSFNVFTNPGPESFTFDGSLLRALLAKGTLLPKIYEHNFDQNKLEHALETLATAMELMDRNQDLYELEGSTLLMASEFYSVFEEALNLCHILYKATTDQSYLETAFMVMEKSKARLLFDSFLDLRQKQLVGVPDSVLETENTIKSELLGFSQELEKEQDKSPVDNSRVKQLQEKVFEATVALKSYYESLEDQYPQYTKVIDSKTADLITIQAKLSKSNTVLLSYLWGDSTLFSLIVEGDRVNFFKQSIDTVTQLVTVYQKHILQEPQFTNQATLFREFSETANNLYRCLFNGVNLEQKPLVIAADGPLRFIPFEGLIVRMPEPGTRDYGELEYLVRYHPTSYDYSANLWTMQPQIQQRKLKVLGFSYSGFGQDALEGPNELLGTAQELELLKSQLKGEFFSGPTATKQNFIDNVRDYNVVHLAIHGISDSVSRLNNRLLFRDPNDQDQTDPLYTYELYNLQFNARLAVLSACESGIGKNYRGEGVYSMSRAFSYAGCPTTVMSLWKISDKTTPEILGQFYRQLKRGMKIDQALRSAKLNYLADNPGNFSHPNYWAAMVVHGSTDRVVNRSRKLLIFSILATLLLGLWVLNKTRPLSNTIVR